MRGTLILLAIVSLAVSPASATTITWGVKINDNGDGSSRYRIKAMTDDMAIVGFTGTFHCSETIAQLLGYPDEELPCDWKQIDKRAEASAADDNEDCPFDKNKDSHIWSAFDFIGNPWTETDHSYGGFAGQTPPYDTNLGKGSYAHLAQLVAPTGLDFQTAIGQGDFGYRGDLGLWNGVHGNPVVRTDAPFGIPEPGTIALLCSGGLALLWMAFRRRKRLRTT